ncbi:PHP domain-containing protein [Halorubrum ezzemoulense]|uniref:PHP domain-containing protein n=1 Tax=Halorubrum ezzemoulense TaxID=337243 RepID=A0ABT4Z522_HALEZ|nr:PHP domain-containing protein [Halorubrum ezzemoulense]MDB2293255.1 PHP domain-containing protein [Halorubrum ezzemoulense]
MSGEETKQIHCDLHMHSNYSFDSFMSPKFIIKSAKIRNTSIISVTDHGNMDIYLNEFTPERREQIFNEYGIFIVPGMEIKTNRGDVIGLFLNKEITSTTFSDVVAEIKDQDGIVMLPHPYHRDCDPRELIPEVDILETVNGRCRSQKNDQAVSLSESMNVPSVGGSDAHMYWEIGQIQTIISGSLPSHPVKTDVIELICESKRTVRGSPLPFLMTHGTSLATERVKTVLGLTNQ